MPTTIEAAIEILANNRDVLALARQLPHIVEGMQDLVARLQACEKSRLADQMRMQQLETLTAEEKTELASIAKDRTDLQHRVAALEQRIDAEKNTPRPTPVPPAPSPTIAESLGFAKPATPPATAPA